MMEVVFWSQNHPMGAADAIALYSQLYKVREDIFFFANELFVYLLGSSIT